MSDTLPGVRAMHDIEGFKNVIEDYTGSRPLSCPWFAFQNLFVQDVVHVRPLLESGQAHLMLGDDPPALLVDAIAEYEATLNAVQAKLWRKERARAEAERKKREQQSAVKRGVRRG